MGQKLFGRIKDRMHRVKGQEMQAGDKFSFRMARFIIHKKGLSLIHILITEL